MLFLLLSYNKLISFRWELAGRDYHEIKMLLGLRDEGFKTEKEKAETSLELSDLIGSDLTPSSIEHKMISTHTAPLKLLEDYDKLRS